MNTACVQISYVIKGEAIVHYEGKEFPIKSGDDFFFEKESPIGWIAKS
jgi:mannose-6-phosphate isomerase-like protein (cupin superfamily)